MTAHVRHINAWIIAQYEMTRAEVENVMKNDWLHQFLTNGCLFDVIGHIASTGSASDLAGFTARRSDETHRYGSFQYNRTVQNWMPSSVIGIRHSCWKTQRFLLRFRVVFTLSATS
jgi:hypothetical protein